jgi:hypothetical protein
MADKIRENRLRRMAERQGFALRRSRRRDPHALDYGIYWIIDLAKDTAVASGSYPDRGMDLDEVEEWLQRPWEDTKPSRRDR